MNDEDSQLSPPATGHPWGGDVKFVSTPNPPPMSLGAEAVLEYLANRKSIARADAIEAEFREGRPPYTLRELRRTQEHQHRMNIAMHNTGYPMPPSPPEPSFRLQQALDLMAEQQEALWKEIHDLGEALHIVSRSPELKENPPADGLFPRTGVPAVDRLLAQIEVTGFQRNKLAEIRSRLAI